MKKTSIIIILLVVIAALVVINIMSRQNQEPTPSENQQEETLTPVMTPEGDQYMVEEGSVLGWEGRKIIGTSHVGNVPISEGSIVIQDGEVVGGTFVFDMMNLSADGSGVANHLRSNDWFGVEEYPTAQFRITDVTDGQVTGQLTIVDRTEPLTFPAEITMSDTTVTVNADFEFDRTLWGIIYGSGSFFADLGDEIIDDMVSVSFSLTANKEVMSEE